MPPWDRAAQYVEEVSERFSDIEATTRIWQAGDSCVPSSLDRGCAGMSLLYAELAHRDTAHRALAHAWLTAAARSRQEPSTAGIFRGAAALSFAAHCAAGHGGHYARTLAGLDERLAAMARAWAEREARRVALGEACVTIHAYDAITGLAGLGGHLVARGLTGAAAPVLEAVVALTDPIEVSGVRLPGWWVAQDTASYAPTAVREGHANLGMAHGVAGLLALLSLAWRDGSRVAGQREAATVLAGYLLERRRDDGDGVWWPPMLGLDGAEAARPRPSWCYGTPGVARALYLAGAAFDVAEWRDAAVRALRSVLRPSSTQPPLNGPGLCHGWAGLLQITWRTAQESSDDELAARLPWIAARLLDAAPGAVCGTVPGAARPGYVPDDPFGFLTGAAGAALALHTCATGTQPATPWERALLIA
ncbi:lanthionine synthetase C family protein [Streptomyces sp. TS71-3]|uniref:lanthionine synthetase C family protein n=1 Tax=Streptomyces sp. TS71-3 TaxID=2733862 RepID=UPI001BB4120F|nr:lanthionine synthetase C family protein [Streptomyces sp. TS71-3]